MLKFQKKPVIIEAYQWTQNDQYRGIRASEKWPEWLRAACDKAAEEPGAFSRRGGMAQPLIQTLEGEHRVSVGDWIISGVAGELYPCKPDIFEQTYRAWNTDSKTSEAPPVHVAARRMREHRAGSALVAAGLAVDAGGRLPSTIGITVLVTHQGDESNTIDVVMATELFGDNLRDTLAQASPSPAQLAGVVNE